MEGLGFKLRHDAETKTPTEQIFKTSEVEGEWLNVVRFHSSIARRLFIDIDGPTYAGIVQTMLDATCDGNQPLTADRCDTALREI